MPQRGVISLPLLITGSATFSSRYFHGDRFSSADKETLAHVESRQRLADYRFALAAS
jgi:hypothetical protein